MIGPNYWTTGIVVLFAPPAPCSDKPRYGAWLEFFDDGWAQDGSTEGKLRIRYVETDLAAALDVLIADAKRLGIEFKNVIGDAPILYVKGDGEDVSVYLPADWGEQLQAQATRLGWATYEEVES